MAIEKLNLDPKLKGQMGAKTIYDYLKAIGNKIDEIIETNPISDNAGYHNSIFRGKNVTNYYDDGTLFTRISSGKFDDLFVGDYIVKNGITWRIAGFDIYLRKGSASLTKHHACIIPDNPLINAKMNDAKTTVDGYAGSKMFTETLSNVLSTYITPVFADHVITYINSLTNSVDLTGYNRFGTNTGCSNGWSGYNRKLDLMNEVQVFGTVTWSSSGFEIGCDNVQLPLFRLAPHLIISSWYWLRNIVSASGYSRINELGISSYNAANYEGGVRPYFYID